MTLSEYIEKSNQRQWVFPLVADGKVKNIRKIHPLKQKLVCDIVSLAKQDDGVREIIVYGSATSNRCHEGSDLDICIAWNFDCFDEEGVYVPAAAKLLREVSITGDGHVDVMPYTSWISEDVVREIKKGVVIYVQDA